MKLRMLALLFLLIAPLSMAKAAPAAGLVLSAAGEAFAVTAEDGERALRRRSEVFAGDTLRTGADGRLQVRFADGEVLALRPDSELRVDEFVYDAQDTRDNRSLKSLVKGGMRAITGAVGGEQYRVETPAATIGVRGTMFSLHVEGEQLYVAVLRGAVGVSNAAGDLTVGLNQAFSYAVVGGRSAPPQGRLSMPEIMRDGGQGGMVADRESESGDAAEESSADVLGDTDSADFSATPAQEDRVVLAMADGADLNGAKQVEEPVYDNHVDELGDLDVADFLQFDGSYLVGRFMTPLSFPRNDRADGTIAFGFVFDDDNHLSIHAGEAPVTEDRNVDLNVDWGVWNASADYPVVVEGQENGEDFSDSFYASPLYWITGGLSDPAVVEERSATATYNELIGFLGGSAMGQLGWGDQTGAMELALSVDFNAATFDGNLQLSFYDESTYASESWDVQFDGGVMGAQLSVEQLTGVYEQLEDGVLMLNLGLDGELSSLMMHFVGEQAEAISGSYMLVAAGEGLEGESIAVSADGVFLLREAF